MQKTKDNQLDRKKKSMDGGTREAPQVDPRTKSIKVKRRIATFKEGNVIKYSQPKEKLIRLKAV